MLVDAVVYGIIHEHLLALRADGKVGIIAL
jgi:hypothetical protein